MRLQAVLLPDALARAQQDASRGSNRATGPVGGRARRLGTGEGQHLGGGSTPNSGLADARLAGDLEHEQALGGEQDDVGALDVLLRLARPTLDVNLPNASMH